VSRDFLHKILGLFVGFFSGDSGNFGVEVERGRLQRFAEVRQDFLRLIRAHRLLRPAFLIFTIGGKRGRYPHFQAGINLYLAATSSSIQNTLIAPFACDSLVVLVVF
jgi:hypothetical protein